MRISEEQLFFLKKHNIPISKIFDASKVDTIIEVSEQEAREMTKRLAKEEGVFAGMSSGGSVTVAVKLAEQMESGVIVAIICDRGDRYLSSDLFDCYRF